MGTPVWRRARAGGPRQARTNGERTVCQACERRSPSWQATRYPQVWKSGLQARPGAQSLSLTHATSAAQSRPLPPLRRSARSRSAAWSTSRRTRSRWGRHTDIRSRSPGCRHRRPRARSPDRRRTPPHPPSSVSPRSRPRPRNRSSCPEGCRGRHRRRATRRRTRREQSRTCERRSWVRGWFRDPALKHCCARIRLRLRTPHPRRALQIPRGTQMPQVDMDQPHAAFTSSMRSKQSLVVQGGAGSTFSRVPS